jgi:hypothetical protein
VLCGDKTRLTPVPVLFSRGIMPRWPDKIAEAVTFDVAFALNFKVWPYCAPAHRIGAQGCRQEHRRSLGAIELGDRARRTGHTHITGCGELGMPCPPRAMCPRKTSCPQYRHHDWADSGGVAHL